MLARAKAESRDLSPQFKIMYAMKSDNILLHLERRQWQDHEQWAWQRFHSYCSEKLLKEMPTHSTFQRLSTGHDSVMSVAFSCNGEFLACGLHSHKIHVYHTSPVPHLFLILPPFHPRTPWCLTFDPIDSHLLYSGCLGGTVCKWNINKTDQQVDQLLMKTWKSGVSSPVASIAFLSSSLDLMLVAVAHSLWLLSAESLAVVWQTSTGAMDCRVRLVLTHPECDLTLTAIENPKSAAEEPFVYSLTRAYSPSTCRLQTHYIKAIPNLEDVSLRLLCRSARIMTPHSIAMSTSHVVCVAAMRELCLCCFSIAKQSYGQCLYSVPIRQLTSHTVTSVDILPHVNLILLGLGAKKSRFHMQSYGGDIAEVYKINPKVPGNIGDNDFQMENLLTLSSKITLSCNTALWVPTAAGSGVVCMGIERGEVIWWGVEGGGVRGEPAQYLVVKCKEHS